MDNSAMIQNDPTAATAMMQAFSPTFGNMSFQIDPVGAQGAQISNNFPLLPYVSLEAMLYEQMSANPVTAPFNTLSGSNTGQTVIGGQITQQDSNGTSRFMQGFQSSQG